MNKNYPDNIALRIREDIEVLAGRRGRIEQHALRRGDLDTEIDARIRNAIFGSDREDLSALIALTTRMVALENANTALNMRLMTLAAFAIVQNPNETPDSVNVTQARNLGTGTPVTMPTIPLALMDPSIQPLVSTTASNTDTVTVTVTAATAREGLLVATAQNSAITPDEATALPAFAITDDGVAIAAVDQALVSYSLPVTIPVGTRDYVLSIAAGGGTYTADLTLTVFQL